jgi:plastocyanin
MVKRLLVVFVGLALLCAALVACGGGAGNTGTVTVHTNATNFEQSSVTLKTGQSLQLVNDASDIHIISLGTWQNGVARPEQEPGAPQVQNEQLSANGNLTIGPWNTPGTYHLYCSVHPNMKLTVIVQ